MALNLAKHDWVLSLDADEALTPELQDSILKVKENPTHQGYEFNRLTYYCGHWVRYCGWYPDKKTRLVQKQNAEWRGVNPHDRLEIKDQSPIGFLKGDLLHYSYYTAEQHYKQIEYFGDIAANELHRKDKKTNYAIIFAKTGFQFIKSFILKLGILDGKTGWLISKRSAYATYRKYVKLLNLQKQ